MATKVEIRVVVEVPDDAYKFFDAHDTGRHQPTEFFTADGQPTWALAEALRNEVQSNLESVDLNVREIETTWLDTTRLI